MAGLQIVYYIWAAEKSYCEILRLAPRCALRPIRAPSSFARVLRASLRSVRFERSSLNTCYNISTWRHAIILQGLLYDTMTGCDMI